MSVRPTAAALAQASSGREAPAATKKLWEISTPEQLQYYKATYESHRINPYDAARSAYAVIQRELKTLTKDVASETPTLSSADWDFTLKDGRLVSTGKGLTATDHATLDKTLNGNSALVAAVESLSRAAVAYLQTSEDNPSYSVFNTYTRSVENYTFDNVADQMNGKTQFKDLMAKTEKYVHPAAGSTMDDEGPAVLDILSTS